MTSTSSTAQHDAAPEANAQGVASGSSFYAAMRILPREQRDAMFQIYSFCRQVDDIADSDGPRPERLAALDQWRRDIDALYAGKPPARVKDYAPSVKQFGLRRDDFIAIIDGMEMDVPADIRAPDARTLAAEPLTVRGGGNHRRWQATRWPHMRQCGLGRRLRLRRMPCGHTSR